ncbi:L-threonine dehydratase catabolic TdcB [Calidithermus terrae]|uniref:L-threonine dehydratase catabolic TdcB n=1 Tax=Calidithermus terrae TaxID=1408545 RepID=A0A399ETR1_9DEIN|nr:pyridoxal-phosphate dependent enzyme [Calidithermus terrae]RIH86886.1 L-threonine dehydratase catabolic TdcB [Calidithermus terrae]
MSSRISLQAIEAASRSIDPVFLNSPQFLAESLSAELGVEVVVKVETVNPIRSFKGRGADCFMQRHVGAKGPAPVVCASAGNFGQGMAYAARKHGVPLTVFASVNANALKLERMRALGAGLRLEGEDFDAAKLAAKAYAAHVGAVFVEDSRDVEPTIGAGTIGLELLRYPQPLDALLVPLGNGALLAGVGHWVKAHRPEVAVIGVCAAGAPAMEQSWRSGRLVTHERIHTVADGIGVRLPVPEALEDLRGVVDDVLLVEDAVTLEAMRRLHRHLGLVVEPSGAVGVGALLAHGERFRGRRVATVLCGGNLTPQQVREWLG